MPIEEIIKVCYILQAIMLTLASILSFFAYTDWTIGVVGLMYSAANVIIFIIRR